MIGRRLKSLCPMKVKINDPWDEFAHKDHYNPYYGWHEHSTKTNIEHWQEVDIDMEGLKDLIDKGYKIKINC